MKLKAGVIISEVDGTYFGVAAGEAGKAFNGLIQMNKTAAFIAQNLQEDTTEEQLIAKLEEKYLVSQIEAQSNISKVLAQFKAIGLLE